jgi:hypothetical protein
MTWVKEPRSNCHLHRHLLLHRDCSLLYRPGAAVVVAVASAAEPQKPIRPSAGHEVRLQKRPDDGEQLKRIDDVLLDDGRGKGGIRLARTGMPGEAGRDRVVQPLEFVLA